MHNSQTCSAACAFGPAVGDLSPVGLEVVASRQRFGAAICPDGKLCEVEAVKLQPHRLQSRRHCRPAGLPRRGLLKTVCELEENLLAALVRSSRRSPKRLSNRRTCSGRPVRPVWRRSRWGAPSLQARRGQGSQARLERFRLDVNRNSNRGFP